MYTGLHSHLTHHQHWWSERLSTRVKRDLGHKRPKAAVSICWKSEIQIVPKLGDALISPSGYIIVCSPQVDLQSQGLNEFRFNGHKSTQRAPSAACCLFFGDTKQWVLPWHHHTQDLPALLHCFTFDIQIHLSPPKTKAHPQTYSVCIKDTNVWSLFSVWNKALQQITTYRLMSAGKRRGNVYEETLL